ncbi:MAG TPA: hypothetical protein VM582_01705 [Candidatus Thermoplasmatota archaeon]|nr:hypothetical protein [Candidatus Thermoplasmatota archaeon]
MSSPTVRALGFAIALVLVALPAPLSPAGKAAASQIDTSGWMQAGSELVFSVKLSSSFTWKMVVASASATEVTTRWLFNDETDVVDAVFDRSTRQLLRSSGTHLSGTAYGFTWIGEADVARGWARLGHDNATYAGKSGGKHVFQSPGIVYKFDALDGRLLEAGRTGGASMTYSSSGSRTLIPEATIRELFPPAQMQMQMASTSSDGGDGAVHEIPRHCERKVKHVFGEGSPFSCPEEAWTVRGTSSVQTEALQFSLLTVGSMRMTLNHTASYYDESCVAEQPSSNVHPVCAGARTIDTSGMPGRHRLWATVHLRFCLNPLYEFTCQWDVLATAIGDVTTD